ncbi:MAG: RMD1 family protein [Eubacteriales bacterium]|nr:RMD1 family protein [Eubacteriales bacterium]
MPELRFTTFAIAQEIDLNKVADAFGIRKKYTWEEALALPEQVLGQIDGWHSHESEHVLLFSFGSIVFINSNREHMEQFLAFLKKLAPGIDAVNYRVYREDYALHVEPGQPVECTDRFVRVPVLLPYYPELVSTVMAKSAALERIEVQLEPILDIIESKLDRLEKGRLGLGNRDLARTIARVVRHEYNTIAYIMILDKPDITWTSSAAADFYEKMADFFELTDRYEVIKSKTAILERILDGFMSISHSIRGLFVEWVIVLLIVVEVILMLLDLLR